MKPLSVLFCALAAMAFTLYNPNQDATLKGWVMQQETGLAIPQATVTAFADEKQIATTTTNEQGQYTLNLPPGTYALEFTKNTLEALRLLQVPVVAGNENGVTVQLDAAFTPRQRVTKTWNGRQYNNPVTIIQPAPVVNVPFMSTTSGIMTIKLIDAETKEAIIGAVVNVFAGTTLYKAVVTDVDGELKMTVAPRVYRVEIAYTGYESQKIEGIQVVEGKTSQLIVELKSTGSTLSEVVVLGSPKKSKDKVRSEKADKTAAGKKITSEEIKLLPTRTTSDIIMTPASETIIDGGDVILNGGRATTTDYYIDGIRVTGGVPNLKDIKEVEEKMSDDIDKGSERVITKKMETRKEGMEATKAKAPGTYPITAPATKPEMVKAEELNPFKGNKFETEALDAVDMPAFDELGRTVKNAPPPPPAATPAAGILTAGEWNDLDNWNNHWVDMIKDGEINDHQNTYQFFPRHRYSVLLHNDQGFPIIDAPVVLTDGQGQIIWEARTDNTGKAELWYALHEQQEKSTDFNLHTFINGKKKPLGRAKSFNEGINQFRINRDCQAPKLLDIVWAVDATGSMGDEIEFLKTELLDVIGRVQRNNSSLTIRMGSVFYRDDTDDYLVKSNGLSPDIQSTVAYIKDQYADGGGDTPEAVHSALDEVVYRQKWSDEAVARICFLVLDASPHQTPEINASLQRSIREAARKGIRIVPVSASGVQKDTEFLMKFFGLATNGSYVFLTDDSGVGGKHLAPTTDEYKVEPFNDLLVRIITQYSSVATCDGKSMVQFEREPSESNPQAAEMSVATYFPNPAKDILNLNLPMDAKKVTLYNAEGKSVFGLTSMAKGQHTIPVNQLPAGYYSLRIWAEGQVQSGKVLVVKD
jgi:Carboxypeptidase regulatory-like domain/Secretion system C-terminal sorting domain/von Willebrand factor type A domain